MSNILSGHKNEVVEGNKLIEKFNHPQYSISGEWILKNDEMGSRYHVSVLKYHESWDELMPTWDKFHKWYLEYTKTNTPPRKFRSMMIDAIGNCNMRMAFNILVEAIQWYNSQNTQP
jgi:hypothetical protein